MQEQYCDILRYLVVLAGFVVLEAMAVLAGIAVIHRLLEADYDWYM